LFLTSRKINELKEIFSLAESSNNTGSWGTKDIKFFQASIFLVNKESLILILVSLSSRSPDKIFNSIDLPAQDGPIIPSESPSLIVNEILTIVFLN
jgi:hypothetical protein